MLSALKPAIKGMLCSDYRLTTHAYQRSITIEVGHEFTGKHIYDIPGTLTRWHEARKIADDAYGIFYISHRQHKHSAVENSSIYREMPVGVIEGFHLREVFTKAETLEILRNEEITEQRGARRINWHPLGSHHFSALEN